MINENKKPCADPTVEPGPLPEKILALVDQAEAMIWKLLDEQLDEDDCRRLEQMISDHEEVRQRYLECVQLHVGLHELLAEKTGSPVVAPQSPVLGLLGGAIPGEMPGLGSQPPVS